jgi:cytochrome P450
MLSPMLGQHSLLLLDGDAHKRLRRISSRAFEFSALRVMLPFFGEAALAAVDSWLPVLPPRGSAAHDWTELEFHLLASALTLNIVGRAAFATSDGALASCGGGAEGVFELVTAAMEDAVAQASESKKTYTHAACLLTQHCPYLCRFSTSLGLFPFGSISPYLQIGAQLPVLLPFIA